MLWKLKCLGNPKSLFLFFPLAQIAFEAADRSAAVQCTQAIPLMMYMLAGWIVAQRWIVWTMAAGYVSTACSDVQEILRDLCTC